MFSVSFALLALLWLRFLLIRGSARQLAYEQAQARESILDCDDDDDMRDDSDF